MNAQRHWGPWWLPVASAALLLGIAVWAPGFGIGCEGDTETGGAAEESGEETSPFSANAACYVCHIPFVREELGKVHLKAKVPCIECHGLSAAHANDEDIGATPPDVVFQRKQIDASCVKCHETHDAPARQVIARYQERKLSSESPAVCTDCHGSHKIEQPAEQE
ncbi:MAG: cytochrome c3 family protein [Pirellulales bacterium]|nr:cytochrome c3 family protein [Pirellulales bacterium]